MVRVGKYIVPQIGKITTGARRVMVESRQFAYLGSKVRYPSTIGTITSNVARRTLVEGKNGALLGSRVTGGAIVCCGVVITAARRTLAA